MTDDETHVPTIIARPKMDQRIGLYSGACSCGWVSSGLERATRAMRSAEQHADTKNADAKGYV